MLWTTLANALLIFGLRVIDVSMGTVRTIMIMRGMRRWAALIGFVEVSIWVVAISRVIGSIDSALSVIAYGGGFATGTLLGMWIENKLALGHVDIRIISMDKGQEITQQIHLAGYGATLMQAEGQSGPVFVTSVVTPRRQTGDVIRLVNKVDATAFVTVEEARRVVRGYQRIIK
jgi:uncharacterized protein YebE (UPF0316 family)